MRVHFFTNNWKYQLGWTLYGQNKELLLGSFQGKVSCTTILFSKRVCGTCATQQKSNIVPNVHEFRGHIACDSASESEICIPILVHDKLYAILDIDSLILNQFNDSDQQYLKSIGEIIANELEKIIK